MNLNKNRCFLLVCLFVVLLLISHYLQATLGESLGKIQESDEVKIVSNPKNPIPKNGVKIRIVFEEDLTIGVVEGDENYMFGGRIYFNVDEEGYIYINDWDRKRIQKFDQQGKYILTIGRKGQGPGEFQNAWVPRFDSEGNIYVYDMGNTRISFFNREGEFLRQIKLFNESFSIHYINSNGLLFASKSESQDDSNFFKFSYYFGLFDDQFYQIVEIFQKTVKSKRDTRSRAHYLASIYSSDAFNPKPSFFLAKNEYIYFGYPEKYEIKVFSPEGNLIKIIQREYDPIKVSKKHKENFIKYLENEYFRLIPAPDDIKKKVFQLIKYPKYKPAYQRFTLMENGWLFVVVDSSQKDSKLIDVFDQNGRYIAQFTTSVPTNRLFFKNGKAHALSFETDYPVLKRFKYEIHEFRDGKWVKKK